MSKVARITQKADRVQMTLATDVNVGDIVPLGSDRVAVAATTALAGEENVYYVGGVVVEAAAGEAVAIGDVLYWDAANKALTKTATDNTRAGYAVSATSGAGAVQFVLNG